MGENGDRVDGEKEIGYNGRWGIEERGKRDTGKWKQMKKWIWGTRGKDKKGDNWCKENGKGLGLRNYKCLFLESNFIVCMTAKQAMHCVYDSLNPTFSSEQSEPMRASDSKPSAYVAPWNSRSIILYKFLLAPVSEDAQQYDSNIT